jgi:hypothetical protein
MRSLRILSAMLIGLVAVATTATARDDRLHFPVKEAMEAPNAKAQLDGSVKFFWGNQKFPKPVRSYGVVRTNKKTNFFNKTDKEGCEHAFLSALLAFQERAKRDGANAVVNIKSIYRKVEFVSDTEYECGAGNVTGGVSFSGELVQL